MGQSILAAVLEMTEVHTMARSLGIEVFLLEIRQAADIPPRFAALKGQAEAMYVCTDPLVSRTEFASTRSGDRLDSSRRI
jgi:ABC-type uncharacterized transport system substrate-binding protein